MLLATKFPSGCLPLFQKPLGKGMPSAVFLRLRVQKKAGMPPVHDKLSAGGSIFRPTTPLPESGLGGFRPQCSQGKFLPDLRAVGDLAKFFQRPVNAVATMPRRTLPCAAAVAGSSRFSFTNPKIIKIRGHPRDRNAGSSLPGRAAANASSSFQKTVNEAGIVSLVAFEGFPSGLVFALPNEIGHPR